MNNWHVLLIEDDQDTQEVVSRILRFHNITLDVVSSAEEALPFLENQRYTAAIVDLALPGMDGWQLLNIIRGEPRTAGLPCLAITAYHSADLAIKAIKGGFTAYLPKPIDSATFVNNLEDII